MIDINARLKSHSSYDGEEYDIGSEAPTEASHMSLLSSIITAGQMTETLGLNWQIAILRKGQSSYGLGCQSLAVDSA